jgi:hypothetical protein
MLLPTSIIANSTTQNCRRSPFFNRLRKEKWGPQKTNHSDRFLQVRVQARVHQYLTPKEQFFDMPSFLKYGSTGRPPGKFHIRHSPKKITENLESPSPPFDILSIEKINNNNNNNNNIICYYDNGGIICNKGVLVDSKAGAGAGAGSVAGAGDDANVDVHINDAVALMNQIEPNRYKYNNNNNNKSISPSITNNTNTTTSITTSTTTSTNNDDETSHLSFIIKLRSERLADRLESNRCKYKFNIDGISTTTTTTTTTAPATGTINYKTSTEGTSNEDGEEAEAPGVSERLADRFESNRSNHNYKYKSKFNIDGILTTTTTAATTTATINYKTSAEGISHEDGEDAEAPGVSERLADRFESNRSNHNYKYKSKFNIDGISTTTTTTTSTNNDDETSHLSLIIKLLSLCLIITKSFSSTTKEPKEKHHHQQQQEHYHAKDRHQFHLEQQQKHQYFKQQHHNVERKAASIVLKLTLVAWDMWTYRNGF